MKFLVTSLFIASSFFTSVSYAINPPGWVYKVALEKPAQIFSQGWVTSGHDKDLLHYLTWSFVQDESTYYIYSNEFQDDMKAIAGIIARNHPGQTVYVYQIRPTDNFHSLEESVRYARDTLPPGRARQELQQSWLTTGRWTQGAWPASAAISGSKILSATPYSWVNGTLRRGRSITNPNYLHALAEASQDPIPMQNATVEEAVIAEDPHDVGFIPGAIVPDECNTQTGRVHAATSNSCLPLKRVPLSTLHNKMIAKMILADILVRSRSGQL